MIRIIIIIIIMIAHFFFLHSDDEKSYCYQIYLLLLLPRGIRELPLYNTQQAGMRMLTEQLSERKDGGCGIGG